MLSLFRNAITQKALHMKPFKVLILGLREAAQRLREHPEQYDWHFGSMCNCGILAQCLLHVDRCELRNMGAIGPWNYAANSGFCNVTGLPTNELFRRLSAYGLERQDFLTIEFLDGKIGYSNPVIVAAYFDTLADQLEERRKNGERP